MYYSKHLPPLFGRGGFLSMVKREVLFAMVHWDHLEVVRYDLPKLFELMDARRYTSTSGIGKGIVRRLARRGKLVADIWGSSL